MKTMGILIRRNVKLFFKDKGLFFTSLITPMILLVLYATFLGNVYRDSFFMSIPEGMTVSDQAMEGMVAGQLFSSLLAVCCVTVAFCSNMLMVQDKMTGARKDMLITPVKPSALALSYYVSTLISTLLICVVATLMCMLYVATQGWFLSALDVGLIFVDVLLLVMFGTALSSLVNFFLSSQGQISAVGTIVSSGYGFLCGAYMPISQFPEGLQKVIAFLPGTYGTSLLRRHTMRGSFLAMEKEGIPSSVIKVMEDVVDCNLYFYDKPVEEWTMFVILGGSVVFLIGVYVLIHMLSQKRK
ncbi:MAG: ABC transporter permease [Clostridia bacterium]|nr:ABC transporter permease [Clostridia bacterium]